jgi:hypothetical protein
MICQKYSFAYLSFTGPNEFGTRTQISVRFRFAFTRDLWNRTDLFNVYRVFEYAVV